MLTNAARTKRPNALAIRTLSLRLDAQRSELATCTTAAMTLCVEQAIADTRRQMQELLAA